MGSYSLIIKPSVQKDLKGLSRETVSRVMKRIETLKHEQFPRLATKLAGGEKLHRIRIGDYRVVYAVDSDAQEVTIHYIRHRREVYRLLT